MFKAKTKVLCVISITSTLLMSCSIASTNISEADNNKEISTSDTMQKAPNENITKSEDNYYFFPNILDEYIYNVDVFLEEDIEEVPIEVLQVEKYSLGDVYSIKIKYENCEGRFFWGITDRFDLGMYYVTEDNIYVLTDTGGVPTEDEFLSDGIVVCNETDSENDNNGQKITIKNDDDTCSCIVANTLTESGLCTKYKWKKGEGLIYYSSWYGADGEPIEIELNDNL